MILVATGILREYESGRGQVSREAITSCFVPERDFFMFVKAGSLFLFLAVFSHAAKKVDSQISLPGLPLQLDWADIDQDGRLDLHALMLISQTVGEVDTYFEGGQLRGLYEDETHKEKYFVTYLQTDSGWRETARIELGQANLLGFALDEASQPSLNIWTQEGMTRYRWEEGHWKAFGFGKTPGLLASAPVSLSQFQFWHSTGKGPYWMVPDLAGIHLIEPNRDFAQRMLPYPENTIERDTYNEHYHSRTLQLPQILNIDGKQGDELVFTGSGRAIGYAFGQTGPIANARFEGTLIDLDGDGLADRLQVKENDDIERLKDLPKVTSNIQTFLATGPLTFQETPNTDQDLAGFLIQNNDSDIQLAPPFSDINSDGRLDLAGIAIKLSVWQITKLVAIGRLKIKFLLHLHLQETDGTFRTLANGPYVMTWKLNIRKLKLPEFAQIAADYDGDGWWDILKVGDSNLEITPVTSKGFQNQAVRSLKIPRAFRKSDQAFGRDLNHDGKAEVILIKLTGGQTQIGIMAVTS